LPPETTIPPLEQQIARTTTRLLRLEGVSFLAATGGFVALDGAWWPYLLLVLVPDLGMAGYLAGPRVGSWTHNAVHRYV
jgi:hypothetical protein